MSTLAIEEVEDKARAAKSAAQTLAMAGTQAKNAALHAMAMALGENTAYILDANAQDLAAARERGMKASMQ